MNEIAERVLNWIAKLPDKPDTRVISGQMVGSSSFVQRFPEHIVEVQAETGRWIALIGADFGWMDRYHATDWPDARPILINWWNAGGLVTISWEMPAPASGVVDMGDLITSGTAVNTSWMVQVSQKADWLAELAAAGVVVLWRPFHEMNLSRGSHWWCEAKPNEFIKVWQYLYDYLVVKRNISNLVWVYSPAASGGAAMRYYPGDDYVDIVGLTKYVGGSPMSEIAEQGYAELLATGKPFALCEVGPGTGSTAPPVNSYDYQMMISDIRTYCPKTTYFMAWDKERAITRQLNAIGLMNDDWVISRDEVSWTTPGIQLPSWVPDWATLADIEIAKGTLYRSLADLCDAAAREYNATLTESSQSSSIAE